MCVQLSTVIPLYCLHLITAQVQWKNVNTDLQWFTVKSTLLHCNVYGSKFYKMPSLVFNFSHELKCRNPFAKQCMYKVGGFTIETYSVGNCSIRSFRDKFDYITFLRTAQRSVSSKKFYNFKLQYFSQCSFIEKMNNPFSITAKIWYI